MTGGVPSIKLMMGSTLPVIFHSRLFIFPSALLAEPLAVLNRVDEGAHHLRVNEVAVELVELREPEVVAVEVRVGRVVRVAPEVAEVLHQDEGAVEFEGAELGAVGDLAEHGGARLGARVEAADEGV